MTHDLDMRLLRAFVRVADLGSFSAAANALHITQPALSRRIGELESTLGLRLFDRTSRRVDLTEAGDDLLARCKDLLTHGDSFRERALALVEGKAGVLRIGCAPVIMEAVVAPLIVRFRRLRPDVELQLYEHGAEHAQGAVLRGQLHAAVASPTEPRLHAQPLFPWRLLAIVSDNHPLACAQTVDIGKLVKEPLLTLPQGFATRVLLDAACETAGVRPIIRMEATAAQTLVAAARAGYGVAIVPSVLLMNKHSVKALPVLTAKKSLGRWIGIVWDTQRAQPPYLAEFTDMLVHAMKHHYPGDEYRFAPAIKVPRSI